MKHLHYILAVLVFLSMAISVSIGPFIFVAIALYLIQLILIGKKNEKKASKGGGSNEPGIDGPIKDLPGKETGA